MKPSIAQVPFGPSAFNEAVSGQGGVSDRHRQAVADLVHLRRNSGPEIAILRSDIEVALHSVGNRAKAGGRSRSPPPLPSSSLLLDALDTYGAEAGVFLANLCLKLRLFDIECLERVYVGKL